MTHRQRFVIPWLLIAGPLFAAPPAPPLKQSVTEIPGALVIDGGGKTPDIVTKRFVELAGGAKARLVIIPTASQDADRADADMLLASWKKHAVESVHLFHARSRDQANDAAFIKPLTAATGVWLGGGDQTRLVAAYSGTAVERELKNLLGRAGVIGGTSAGAAVMSHIMITGGVNPPTIGQGFGFLPGAVVDQHFLRRNRVDRLMGALANHPGLFGLGIDEETAVVVKGRRLSVLGNSYAVACLSASSTRPAGFQVLHAGDQADLFALHRSAVARSEPPFPSAKPPTPRVANGTLMIGGGGGLAEDIWKKFIHFAGGPDSLIVVIPTANDDPVPNDPSEARLLRKAGATNVKVLHTRRRAEADRPEFVAPLKQARGIWFTGGRQWRFVDAYEGTAAERAFHELLQRGGVIGGSSAGASIQADYMVRGDPLGNLKIMAEGYERGFGFLQGVAIDQHFFRRNRFKDMTALMAVYPQLLGIGIDEGTILIVRGSVMEVAGKSTVAVYDRRKPVTGNTDYDVLTPGTRYDLEKRERITPTP
jgi:cyanophycinase